MTGRNLKTFDSSNLSEEEKAILSDFSVRRKTFDDYLKNKGINLKTCPGCGFPTLPESGVHEICIVCNWQDDGQDDLEADKVWGGPNYHLSLTENRLAIGKELNAISDEVNGKIIDDPGIILSLFSTHNAELSRLFDQLPEDPDRNHPIFTQYRQMGESLLNRLIIGLDIEVDH